MAVLGIAVNPAAGLLFDCFGFLNVSAFTSFLAFLVPFTLMVPILWVQLLNLFFLVTWFSLFLNAPWLAMECFFLLWIDTATSGDF